MEVFVLSVHKGSSSGIDLVVRHDETVHVLHIYSWCPWVYLYYKGAYRLA